MDTAAGNILFLNFALKGAILMIFTWMLWLGARRFSASSKHAILLCGAVGLLLLPLMTFILPQRLIAVDMLASQENNLRHTEKFIAHESVTQASPSMTLSLEAAEPDLNASEVKALPETQSLNEKSESTSMHWSDMLIGVWLAGLGLFSLRVLIGHVVSWDLLRSANPLVIQGSLLKQLFNMTQEMGFQKTPKIYTSPKLVTPVVCGVLKPRVVLPQDCLKWSRKTMRIVLRHEFDHIRRRDCFAQSIVQLACAMHWFNPLVWWMSRQVHIERENACDDEVIASGVPREEYANELLALAGRGRHAYLPQSAIAMASASRLENRLSAIMDAGRKHVHFSKRAYATVVMFTFLGTSILASFYVHDSSSPVTLPTFTGLQEEFESVDTENVGATEEEVEVSSKDTYIEAVELSADRPVAIRSVPLPEGEFPNMILREAYAELKDKEFRLNLVRQYKNEGKPLTQLPFINDLKMVNDLILVKASQGVEIAKLSKRYRSKHPKMIVAQEGMKQIDSELSIALERAVVKVESEYMIAEKYYQHLLAEMPEIPEGVEQNAAPRTFKVHVLGEVRHPGTVRFQTTDEMSLVAAISGVGGVLETASTQDIIVRRERENGEIEIIRADLDLILKGKFRDVKLKANDSVFVRERGLF